jgi:Flp pilus assembly protein TadG
MFLLGVTVDYGWYFHNQIAVTNCAAVGAHAGAAVYAERTLDPITTARAVTLDAWTSTGLPNQPTVTVTRTGAAPDEVVSVRAVVDYNALVDVQALVDALPQFLGAGTVIPSTNDHTATYRLQNQF